jgi:hypothetical protein
MRSARSTQKLIAFTDFPWVEISQMKTQTQEAQQMQLLEQVVLASYRAIFIILHIQFFFASAGSKRVEDVIWFGRRTHPYAFHIKNSGLVAW